MRRRLARLLPAALVLGTLGFVPAPPAAADTNVCAGQGVANVGPGLTYPVTATTSTSPAVDVRVRQPRTAGFAFNFSLGTCAPDLGKALNAGGVLTGWCGHSSGQGVTSNGHRFAWISAGGVMLFTGEVTGVGHAKPDPTWSNNTCNSVQGAFRFLIEFVVVLDHCRVIQTSTLLTVPIPPFLTATTIGPTTWGIHTGPLNEHVHICV